MVHGMSKQIVATTEYRPRLLVHVVWHPKFAREPEQPNARGLGIPVFFRSESAEGKTPPPIAMDEARTPTTSGAPRKPPRLPMELIAAIPAAA
jgi:hypothetical protein